MKSKRLKETDKKNTNRNRYELKDTERNRQKNTNRNRYELKETERNGQK